MQKIEANESKHALSENFRGLRLQMLSATLQCRAALWVSISFVHLLACKLGSRELPKYYSAFLQTFCLSSNIQY
jgi:hypothetical protein